MNGSVLPFVFMGIAVVAGVSGLVVAIVPPAAAILHRGLAGSQSLASVGLCSKDRVSGGILITLLGSMLLFSAITELRIRNIITSNPEIQFPVHIYELSAVQWVFSVLEMVLGLYCLLRPASLARLAVRSSHRAVVVLENVAWWAVVIRIMGVLWVLTVLSRFLFIAGR